MDVGAIGLGGASMQGGSFSSGGSRTVIELNINKLRRQRDEYEKFKQQTNSPDADKKIGEIDRRLGNLENTLSKIKAREEKAEQDDGECETCKNRKYQDGSNDPGVSFKMASRVGPEGAEAAVRGHEYEHVNRNQAKAAREGKEIVFQSVQIKHAICPECGKSYAAGGETKTVTRDKPEYRFNVGLRNSGDDKGKLLDTAV